MNDITATAPEPGTWLLLITGLMGGAVFLKSGKRLKN
jgi:hypothetical protein